MARDAQVIPQPVLDMFPMGEDACYAAHFDAKALKPGQKLTEFYHYRLFDPDPAKEAVEFTREEAVAFDRTGFNANWTAVVARFGDKPLLYSQPVTCDVYKEGGKVNCGVDCDGGYFGAEKAGGGIKVSFAAESGGLVLIQSCGDPDEEGRGRWLTDAEAGSAFVVEKQPIAQCLSIDREARPGFVTDPVPLRERIAMSGWRCFSRTCDTAHLAKHPRQQVTAMAVAINGPVEVDKVLDEHPYTRLEVTLSFKTRNGNIQSRDVNCSADAYQFRCEGGFRLRRRDGASAFLLAGEYGGEAAGDPVVIDTVLGGGDLVFRLDASGEDSCRVD